MIGSSYFLLCLAMLISTGYAIMCYSCEATNATLCSKGTAQLREVDCGLENPRIYRFCLYKEVYDRQTGEVTYSHGCELIGKPPRLREVPQCLSDAKPPMFREIPQCLLDEKRYRVQVCRLCFTDLCTFQAADSVMGTHFLTLLCLSAIYILDKVSL